MENKNNCFKLPYELFGVECGTGWKELYQPIFDWIKEYNESHKDDEKIIVHQVKEKYGGLRFYVNFYPKELDELISNAENESYEVCEICGSRKNVGITIDGWYETVCSNCLQKTLKNNNTKHYRLWEKNDNKKVYKVSKDKIEQHEITKSTNI